MSLASSIRRLLRRGKSADPGDLAGFLHARGAYVAQKSVLDYLRVKAGHREREVFADPDFQAALEHCRWQTFAWTLVDVTALAEAWLRPHVPAREAGALAAALVALHDRARSVEPPPEAERAALDDAARALPGHLAALQLAPPRTADRIPLLTEAPLFATLPVHPDERVGETPAIRGGLRFLVVSTQQEMERAFDAPRLAAALLAPPSG